MYNFPTPLLAGTLKKIALWSHRWSGTAFCILFLWWFLSGIFMMYFDYPEVKQSERLARGAVLASGQVRLSPPECWARLDTPGAPDETVLSMFNGRPAYRFRIGRSVKVVYADNGEIQRSFSIGWNLRTAAAWTRLPPGGAAIKPVSEVDQWTVGGVYRESAPLDKYTWPDGEQVYVSEASGEIVQYTTRLMRVEAWLGPIPHWLYFTPLRTRPKIWTRVVIGLSSAATIVALLGLFAGLSMYSPSKRYRQNGEPTAVPYRGAKRLHMIFGLFFGVVACTWTFSGMLSMDPFPARATPESQDSARIHEALNGDPFTFEPFMGKSPREALEQVRADLAVRELDLILVAGEPYYLAMQDVRTTRLIPVSGPPVRELNHAKLVEAVVSAGRHAGMENTQFIGDYDAYYLDRRRELPLPVLRVRLKDPGQTRFYIDPRTGTIVGEYNSSRWAERWLYHGLHSINLPWLYRNRPAWDIVVLFLMLGGVSLSFTSVLIGWRFVRNARGARAGTGHVSSKRTEQSKAMISSEEKS